MERSLVVTALAAVVAGLLAILILHFGRGFPWSLAGIVGVAVAVLTASALRTSQRLVRLWRGAEDDG